MSESISSQMSTSQSDAVPLEVLRKPSNVIRTCERTIEVGSSSYELTLITMKRSFLLVIDNVDTDNIPRSLSRSFNVAVSSEELIQNFMSGNSSLKGLSLAIGGHSTCLIASENSLASASLASRLSKSLNNNGPVYVANNMQAPSDILDQHNNITNLYERIFQFVRQNFKGSQTINNEGD